MDQNCNILLQNKLKITKNIIQAMNEHHNSGFQKFRNEETI